MIRDMFAEKIDREINGVVRVDQDTADVIDLEVKEYVITNELKKHFITFFNCYNDAFTTPTADIGVWISGFFGSGKSHFLKMLSYLLENRAVKGSSTVERFREKFADDPATFMLIEQAARAETETVLFNIDIEGFINKDKTVVLRVFAKMFYSHLGFYGENLKVAMLEQYIDQLGKTEEFRRVFEEKRGKSWLEQRKAFAFNGKFIIPTLMQVLDMSEDDAKRWFQDKAPVDFSIARLVEDIKAYISGKPQNFRLLFMIDEVGQYVGMDTDMLLNLQSLAEKIGSECGGKVWIVCTGQEAIDEIIKVRMDEFSRIQARFKTRLSLSSSSVDEVIQKRILKKKPEFEQALKAEYESEESGLRNLFSFKNATTDIKGYSGAAEFAADFPFVPYQFLIIQKAFTEIRRHGNSGKNLSDGERSMLSGFQEAAKPLLEKDECALVPFFRFYDGIHGALDLSIRRVIERCQKAANSAAGIEAQDVNVLKLLYLIRYLEHDIPANVENIAILTADHIRAKKIILRESVQKSLDRLYSQNYIGRTEENTWHFLTDEEQDIAREIRNTDVDTAAIVREISRMIYGDIYTSRKYKYGRYDFDFDKMVDGIATGALTDGMKLRFLTAAADEVDKSELRLMTESKGQAIVVLSGDHYYDSLESAMKIKTYVGGRNDLPQLPQSVQNIIRDKQREAHQYEESARAELKKAIERAEYYVDGEHIPIKRGEAKACIDQALEYLVAHVYSELHLIEENADTDADILEILSGGKSGIAGMEANQGAVAAMEEFLFMQEQKKLPTSMFDVQNRYQAIPYGWREIDIAAVTATLIVRQKATIKYGGATIQPSDPKLPDMLRKRTETGKARISRRKIVSPEKMKRIRGLLREYFDVMDVPDDEDGLVAFIVRKFAEQKEHYTALDARYTAGRNYPDRPKVQRAVQLMGDVLSQQKDNVALIDRVLKLENDLFDSKEAVQAVEGFFRNQAPIFDAAVQMERDLSHELDYLSREAEANAALNKIRLIVTTRDGFSYRRIPELNGLMATVREGHNRLLAAKREEIGEFVTQCMAAIHQAAKGDLKVRDITAKADEYFTQKRRQIEDLKSLALLDSLVPQMLQYKDGIMERLEALLAPPPPKPPVNPVNPVNPVQPEVKKIVKSYNRQIVFPAKRLESDAEIDAYVEGIRAQLKQLLKNCDGIQLK